nr:MAG TPA: Large subunit terminase [Caudoviricetes sp.]
MRPKQGSMAETPTLPTGGRQSGETVAAFERLFRENDAAGRAGEGLRGGLDMTREPVLRGTPNPRQEEFFKATARHIAYGGARGGGKSWAMRRKFVLLALHYEGLRLLLLRRTFPELQNNHIRQLCDELCGGGKAAIARYNKDERTFTFQNGSIIKLGYCDAEGDVLQYQGQEYDVVGFEEATQFTEYQMQYISTTNRSTRKDFSPRIYYTCNPGGVGHDYIKRLFIDRDYREGENPEDYVFIPARVTDNPVLMDADPEYVKLLMALPEDLRRAHLDGDWDVVSGQFFKEFRRAQHVVEPFPIPVEWKRFRAMDWGYNDPCCVLWFAVAPDRRLYIYREIYQSETLAADMARLIRQENGLEQIAYTVASPDMWQRRGTVDVMGGESIAETFLRAGVPLMKADNSRIVGWQRVRECLAKAPDGLPYVQIFSSCANLVRTLPLLTYSRTTHEDVSGNCEDHAAEAMRYGLMSRPSPARQTRPKGKVLAFDPLAEPRRASGSGFMDL